MSTFDYVKDAGLKPRKPYVKRKTTNLIILHHVEGSMTPAAIHKMHMAKGNRGIDYNIYVGKDGVCWWGRGLEYEGGHVSNSGKTAGMNARSVGIVCNGNFMKERMSAAQLEALKQVVADVVRHYGFTTVRQIVTHREAAGEGYTDCPGTHFPANEVREFIRTGGTAQPTQNDPLVWQVTVGTLNFREKPDMSARVLRQLHRGDRVRLERYVAGEDWARVNANGQTGWVWLRYIGEL